MAEKLLIFSVAKRAIKPLRKNEEIKPIEADLMLLFLNTKNGELRPWDERLRAFRGKHNLSDESFEELAIRVADQINRQVGLIDPKGKVIAGSFYNGSGPGFRFSLQKALA